MFSVNYATVIDPVLRDIRRQLAVFAGMKAGESVLDVCCGSGAQVCEYRRRGMAAYGLDNDPRMLGLAQRYYKECGITPGSLVLGDAAHLPFDDESFDYVSVCMALHDKTAVLANAIIAEMQRVTHGGGKLVFVDYSTPLAVNASGYLIRAIEFLAGGEHASNFRHYLADGGLNSLLGRHQLGVIKEYMFKKGNISMLLVSNATSSGIRLQADRAFGV